MKKKKRKESWQVAMRCGIIAKWRKVERKIKNKMAGPGGTRSAHITRTSQIESRGALELKQNEVELNEVN